MKRTYSVEYVTPLFPVCRMHAWCVKYLHGRAGRGTSKDRARAPKCPGGTDGGGAVERQRSQRGKGGRAATRSIAVIVTLDQSVLDGAPQCPGCYAHLMQRQCDGSFACPGGCPERVVLTRASVNAVRGGAASVFRGRLGDIFRIKGRA